MQEDMLSSKDGAVSEVFPDLYLNRY
jgi:hypothetical protein